MLYLMGMGLRGVRSLTLEEREILSYCDIIYLENYTSVLSEKLKYDIMELTGKDVQIIERRDLETSDLIAKVASSGRVSLLVSGDPLMATTHNSLRLRCIELGIGVMVMENASILNTVIGYTGLSPYKVAPPISIPRVSEKFFPMSVYNKIHENIKGKRHSLILLDTGDGHPMYIKEALETLLLMENRGGKNIIGEETQVICAIRVGSPDQRYYLSMIRTFIERDIRDTPAVVIIPSEMDHNELEFTSNFCEKLSASS